MKSEKGSNLLQLSSRLMTESEMRDVFGKGVACHPSDCGKEIHISVSNGLNNMRKNNPPVEQPTTPIL